MESVSLQPADRLGGAFVPAEFIPPGQDEYYLRDVQIGRPVEAWRHLRAEEVDQLRRNGNGAEDWDEVLVSGDFDAELIRNTRFHGRVRIGRLRPVILEHEDLRVPAGITNSVIIASDVGDDVAIHDVRYLAHYIIGERCILVNIDELRASDRARFGNGIVKEGEPESARVWLAVMNEGGGRRILCWDGMIAADAYLWAKYRDDAALQARLKELTQRGGDARRGYYGTVGPECVIRSCRVLKDVRIGAHACIQGAERLEDLTIESSAAEPSRIGDGVELEHGIVGYGCNISHGSKAVRFVLGNSANLKYGARLIDTVLGDNSTVSCCEVLNNLIFPGHEQHHNNSFLIAAVVLGQSNIAAGATIGSNHNSRANDNEVEAGRGFWPGLCTSVKHPSRFASFTLLAKGDYPAELDIPLPFALVNNNVSRDELEIMPAYWWLHNMFALARHAWKYRSRDQRRSAVQHIEFDVLAPDTIEEIRRGRHLLELWVGRATVEAGGGDPAEERQERLRQRGREVLGGTTELTRRLLVRGERLEKSDRNVVVLRPQAGYQAYGDMLHYYAVKNLAEYWQAHPQATLATMLADLGGTPHRAWTNLGGQLVPTSEVDRLRADIGAGRLASWQAIHERYDELWQQYPREKQRQALAVLCELCGVSTLTATCWREALERGMQIQEYICAQVHKSRQKDFDNPFCRATYRNLEEMRATVGTVDDSRFVQQIRQETAEFKRVVADLSRRV